ncbi:ATP synthase peripheral stalk subunit F6, mitochondrial isoform 1-T1 [Callospermophilus lateralis]|uniref:ATP synthase peripheral stalk subunit F6, mitochondrial isoform X1 n=2 Tax=Callospermophilus lateralis TaxID=76772 RepID=UPI0040540B42
MRTEQCFQEEKRQVNLGEGKMAESSPVDPEALTLHFLLLFGFCLTYSRPVADCLRDASCPYHRITMVLQRLFKFSSVIRSAVSVHLKRNIGVTAVAFNKDLDPIQKLFVDKIREYKTKRQASGGPVDTGPEYQQDLERELFKLKQMYGKADMNTFPNFKFEDPKFEAIEKPQS